MAPATTAELPAEVAAHLLELSELLGGQDTESVGFGLSGDNPEFGLDLVLDRSVGAERLFVKVRRVFVGRPIGVSTIPKGLRVFFNFWTGLVDYRLDLGELLLTQLEFLGQTRQHTLEESESVRGVIAAEPTLASTMWSLAAAPGPAGAGPVPGSGPGLGEDRCWRGEDYNRRYG